MADRAGAVRHGDAADHDLVARSERMHVKPLADADVALPRRDQPLGRREILYRGDLYILLAALNDHWDDTGRLNNRGVVGQRLSDHGAVRRENSLGMKPLRRLRPPQSGALDRLTDFPAGDPLD